MPQYGGNVWDYSGKEERVRERENTLQHTAIHCNMINVLQNTAILCGFHEPNTHEPNIHSLMYATVWQQRCGTTQWRSSGGKKQFIPLYANVWKM